MLLNGDMFVCVYRVLNSVVFIVVGRVAAPDRGLGDCPCLGFPFVVCVLQFNKLWHPVVFTVAAVCVA